jgi:predicted metal-binding membrane protein
MLPKHAFWNTYKPTNVQIETRSVKLLFGVLRYRRAVVAGALILVIAAAWGYLLWGAGIEMRMGGDPMMAIPPEWNLPYGGLILAMWIVMMMAMMLPSAAPTVLLVTVLAEDRLDNSRLVPAAAMMFASGYLLVWCGFSLAATLLQWGLDQAALLSETMALTNAILANAILIAAGVYQWTPLKDACLRHCRSPTGFLVSRWRQGPLGAVRMGTSHGLFCLGCCWMLMFLSFVGGLMNLGWVGAVALFVLVEKAVAKGDWLSRLCGTLLIVWGGANLARLL